VNHLCPAAVNFVACLFYGRSALAQNIVGSTLVNIDQNSGAGTATCETDLDAEAQAYYEAIVNCSVVDPNGNAVAVGQYVDHNNQQGFPQVVLTFTGVTGTTYTATGVHGGRCTLGITRYRRLGNPPSSPTPIFITLATSKVQTVIIGRPSIGLVPVRKGRPERAAFRLATPSIEALFRYQITCL